MPARLAIEPEDLAGDWARPRLRPGDRQRGRPRRRSARRGRRGDPWWPPGRGRRPAGPPWTRHRNLAGGVDRAPGGVTRGTASGQTAPDGSLPQRLLLAVGTMAHTVVGARAPEGREVAQRPLPSVLARDGRHWAPRAGGVRGDPGRVRRVGRTGARHLRGLGGDDGTAPGASAVAAPRGRARRGRRGRVVHHRRQPGRRVRGPARRRSGAPRAGPRAGAAGRRLRPGPRPRCDAQRAVDRLTHGRARPLPQGRDGGHPGVDPPGDRPAAPG